MKLPPPSIRKLFREDFSGQSAIVVDRANLSKESKHWQTLLGQIEGVHVTRHPGDKDSRSKTLCRFTIPEPNSDGHYWRSDELRLEYDSDSRLTIHSYRFRESQHSALVSDLDEIKTFVRHVLERYARRHAGEKKREKVREFKSKAIIAQVRKLAKEEKFDFATSGDTVKLKLFVKLSKHDLIEISVPFKQFEKMLPKLRVTIQSLRELYAEGLRFKIMPVGRLPWNVQWVKHETL
ncbi:hypothetical protein Enr13x_52830 [Stieleria neptunia]|uniref:Uncharacterized protein n=1 Tax=Stieleria neptunia TaxID=2527979 RepID=A0A518HXC6_9BACT|nr:hypothetical protein [Stieleria neptunia]QDV45404.1 hypothetical protein Enr13x_52830 [Stieleria neptunia]